MQNFTCTAPHSSWSSSRCSRIPRPCRTRAQGNPPLRMTSGHPRGRCGDLGALQRDRHRSGISDKGSPAARLAGSEAVGDMISGCLVPQNQGGSSSTLSPGYESTSRSCTWMLYILAGNSGWTSLTHSVWPKLNFKDSLNHHENKTKKTR